MSWLAAEERCKVHIKEGKVLSLRRENLVCVSEDGPRAFSAQTAPAATLPFRGSRRGVVASVWEMPLLWEMF